MKAKPLAATMCILLLIGLSTYAAAQAVYGSIHGTVTDSQGALIQNATVTVTSETKGTVFSAKTKENGDYQVLDLIPDTYLVRFEAQGFKSADAKDRRVAADTSPQLNISLAPGDRSETVTVTDATPTLQTDRSDVGTIVNETYLSDLPLQSRNFTELETLLPGAQTVGWQQNSAEDPQGSKQITIDGLLFSGVALTLDGTENQDDVLGLVIINPIPDDVTEAKIATQDYDPESGVALSATIKVQTKSGSNRVHGGAWEYYQSNAELARNPFTQPAGSNIPAATQNIYGGNLGGPIIHNRTFFFAGYQGLRQSIATAQVATVPTVTAKSTCNSSGNCDLSDYLAAFGSSTGQIYDPSTSGTVPFAGNSIPHARVNPKIAAMLAALPDPTVSGAVFNNYSKTGSGTFDSNQYDIRIDDTFSTRIHEFGRYSYFGNAGYGVPLFGNKLGGPGLGSGGFAGKSRIVTQSLALGGDVSVTPSLFSTLRLGYARYAVRNLAFDAGTPDLATQFGLTGLDDGTPFHSGLPTFEVQGMSSLGFGLNVNACNCPLVETEDHFQLVNNWLWSLKSHTIKLGGDLRFARNLRAQGSNDLGFTNSLTSSASGTGGLGLASLLLGEATSYSGTDYASARAFDSKNFQYREFLYGQDVWKISNKLTMSYGLRWSFISPESVNGKGQGALLNPDTGNMQVAGYGPFGMNMGISQNFEFASPTLGLNYQLTPKTVVRGGYGSAYTFAVFGNTFGGTTSNNIPVSASVNAVGSNSHTPGYVIGNPHPTGFFGVLNPNTGTIPLPPGVYGEGRPLHQRIPRVDLWNVAVQRQLSPSTSITAAYVGNKGTHNMGDDAQGENLNELALTANGLTFNPASNSNPAIGENPNLPISPSGDVRRDPLYSKFGWTQQIFWESNDFNSEYDALQLTFEKQMSHDLQFSLDYAFQKSYAYNGDYAAIDRKVEHGLSTDLRVNSLVAYGTYVLPVGRQKLIGKNFSRPVDLLLGGWELSTILHLGSGEPYWPSYQDCGADRDTGPCTPNYVGGHSFTQHAGSFNTITNSVGYFTPVSEMSTNGTQSGPFTRPQLAHFGNIERNSFFGPGVFSDDMTLLKNFKIKETIAAQFRFDAYNAFNHIALGNPNGCVDCSAASGAGGIFGMAPGVNPRQLDFAVRMMF